MIVIENTIAWMDVPKTGTTSVKHFLHANKIPFKSLGQHCPRDEPKRWPTAILSVRHPALWMRSWWTYRRDTNWCWMQHRWTEHELVSNHGAALNSWEGWVEAITSREEWVYDHFMWFSAHTRRSAAPLRCGPALLQDFGNILNQVGISYSLTGKEKQEKMSLEKPLITIDAMSKIYESNKRLYEMYNFSAIPTANDN